MTLRPTTSSSAAIGASREENNADPSRPVMGRKGIGKLAGFGIAGRMVVTTWQEGEATDFALDMGALKKDAGVVAEVAVPAAVGAAPPDGLGDHGTRITLETLKHKTPVGQEELIESLARRFSRMTRGEMTISVNGVAVAEPDIDYEIVGNAGEMVEETLSDGSLVRYRWGFASAPLRSPLLRGFGIYVNGKTAQAPPFFFNVEGTASGQHGTRYLTGEIEADFLDVGTDDESDIVSTDRQEIDWESDVARPLLEWGDALARKLLREWANRRGEVIEDAVSADAGLKARLERLDPASRKQLSKYLRTLGQSEIDPERALVLADSVVRAFEYRHFHDVIEQIEDVSEDPDRLHELLLRLGEWKVLESRAILEVINGRLLILEKFNRTLVMDVPETAPTVGAENLHDLIASYPWLIDPQWQVFAEEKSVSRQLREWNSEDSDPEDQSRVDFLALTGEGIILVIEIKRTGHVVTRANLRRLEDYADRLRKAHPDLQMVFISGGQYDFPVSTAPQAIRLLTWAEVHTRTARYYEHYRAVLTGDVADPFFARKEEELRINARVLESGSYRTKGAARTVGPQDTAYELPLPSAGQRPLEPDDSQD